jgi:hypothetical protein
VKSITLADKGCTEAVLSVTVKNDIHGRATWMGKDKVKVKKLTDEFTAGLEQIRKEVRREGEKRPQMAPLVRFFEAFTIKSAGQTVVMEGKADAETIQAVFASIFMRGF